MIGWRRFMEGMVAKGCTEVQEGFLQMHGLRGNAKKWATTLSTKLLECTHGQWLYRNVMVHDMVAGTARSLHKEHILGEIERQLNDATPLSEEDQYLLEINPGNIRQGTGEAQEYWLLAIQAARRAKLVREHIPAGIG